MRRRLVTVLALSALLAGACTGPATPTADPQPGAPEPTAGVAASEPPPRPPVTGGTVRVAVADEPDGLNPWADPTAEDVALATRPVLAPLWRVLPDGSAEPWLLASEPEVRGGDDATPLTVVYRLRDDATWSDGQPIDGRDVLFTIGACQRLAAADRGGEPCGDVDLEASAADGTQATVVFTRPVGDWRALLSTLPVLPEHRLAGRDVADLWRRRLPVSSGPFRVSSWTPGERLVLVRNDRWWGERPPLDRVELIFDDTAGVTDLLDGDIDVAAVDATVANVERARSGSRLRVAVEPGRIVESLDFNLASPLVATAAVRTALVAALDRTVLVDEVIRPIAPATRPRRGLLRDDTAADGSETEPAPDPRGLRRVGCEVGDDGVAVCDGERMRLRLAVPGGSWQHRLVGEYVASQLSRAEVEVQVVDGDDDGWDLRVAAVDTTAGPATTGGRWRCDASANTQAYCDPAFDDLLDRITRTVDESERDALLVEADLILRADRPTYPLYPVPHMLAYRSAVRGPAVNSGPWGLTWNTEEWARTVTAPN